MLFKINVTCAPRCGFLPVPALLLRYYLLLKSWHAADFKWPSNKISLGPAAVLRIHNAV